jgi:hypothetical protein
MLPHVPFINNLGRAEYLFSVASSIVAQAFRLWGAWASGPANAHCRRKQSSGETPDGPTGKMPVLPTAGVVGLLMAADATLNRSRAEARPSESPILFGWP